MSVFNNFFLLNSYSYFRIHILLKKSKLEFLNIYFLFLGLTDIIITDDIWLSCIVAKCRRRETEKMVPKQQKSAKKGCKRYLINEPSPILVKFYR